MFQQSGNALQGIPVPDAPCNNDGRRTVSVKTSNTSRQYGPVPGGNVSEISAIQKLKHDQSPHHAAGVRDLYERVGGKACPDGQRRIVDHRT